MGPGVFSQTTAGEAVPLPTTTKGDLIVHNGATDVRLPVGTDTQVLAADSSDDEGVVWRAETVYPDGTIARVGPVDGLRLDDARELRLSPDSDDTHYVALRAADAMSAGYVLQFPDATGGAGQALRKTVSTQLEWFTPFTEATFTEYKTNIQPCKQSAYAVATTNIASLSGDPGPQDGVDFSFGGRLLLVGQTDASENGLWNVNAFGPWARDTTMPDNTNSAWSAIVPVNNGGTDYGNTVWYSEADGSGAVPFVQIPTLRQGVFQVPRLTNMERDAVTASNGMLIYNISTDKFQGRQAGAWVDLT
jgi:hypothetical protein